MRDSIENPRFRDVLSVMTEDMEGGKVLSQCMGSHSSVFDNVFVSLIRAGEQSGQLPEVFRNLADNLKWLDELISQTRRLLIMPLMTLVVVLGVLTALLIFLVPQIAQLFKTMGLALPTQTRLLIAVSEFMTQFWYVVFGLPVVVFVIVTVAVQRSPRAAYMWDYTKLRLPLVGPTILKIILSRFANVFALMYRSGITVLDAIKTSEEVVNNKVISDSLVRAGQQITAGESLSETFQNLGVFPPLVIRMLRVGENTGALDTALMNITYFYNRDVKESVDKAQKALGPAMTVVLGGLLGFVVWAVLGPVYDILGKIKF
jgi:type IV pilus assembly protein PilC